MLYIRALLFIHFKCNSLHLPTPHSLSIWKEIGGGGEGREASLFSEVQDAPRPQISRTGPRLGPYAGGHSSLAVINTISITNATAK